jgi:hypothetical protein
MEAFYGLYSYLSSFLHHVMPSNLKPELPPTDARTGNQVDGLREIGQSKCASSNEPIQHAIPNIKQIILPTCIV